MAYAKTVDPSTGYYYPVAKGRHFIVVTWAQVVCLICTPEGSR